MAASKSPALRLAAASLLLAVPAFGQTVTVTDHGETAPVDFTVGYTGPMTNRFGFDEGESYGQTFTLDEEGMLQSIHIGYNDFQSGYSGTFKLIVDAGNDGTPELEQEVTLNGDDFSGERDATNKGPLFWMEWDVSEFGIILPAGPSSFTFEMVSENHPKWLLAPCYKLGTNPYPDGRATGILGGNAGNDADFAIFTAFPDDDNDGLPDPWELSFDGVQDLTYLDGTLPAGSGPGIGTGDYDGDGLSDKEEYDLKTNPTLADSDGDGINDKDETTGAQNPFHEDHVPGESPAGAPGQATDPTKADTDGDGIADGEEVAAGTDGFITNPNDTDTEGDGMNDGWEAGNQLDPTVDDSDGDPDSDNLDNLGEFDAGTNPQNPDTDDDGYDDGAEDLFGSWSDETHTGTDPLKDDTDGDGIKDGKENPDTGTAAGPVYNTDPNKPDTDGDSLSDGWEILYNLNPTDDGLDADKNPIPGNPNGAVGDPDGDNVPNDKEFSGGTNPRNSDSDGDSYSDFAENGGGTWIDETSTGTDPANADTDGDGIDDGNENPDTGVPGGPIYDTDPNLADTDGDGDADKSEIVAGSDPTDDTIVMDMDGDGYTKATEIAAGTLPDDPASFPRPAANQFWLDFDNADTPNPQPGFLSYSASHEVAESFTRHAYSVFGTTVGLTPSWPDTTDNRVMQMYDRGDPQILWSGDLRPLVRDWIGSDTRTDSGGNGAFDGTTGTPTRLVLTLDGLPADTYTWRSFHHDVEKIHGMFLVEVSTDGGSTFAPVAGTLPGGTFPMTSSTGGATPPADMLYRGFANPGSLSPNDLPSTIGFTFTADGAHDVQIRFTPYTTAQVHRAFFTLDGFQLSGATMPPPPVRIIAAAFNTSGNFLIDFQGDKNATYEVMKSPDLSTGSFAPLATPLTVTTNGVGIGQAIVPASETTTPSTFFRLEER